MHKSNTINDKARKLLVDYSKRPAEENTLENGTSLAFELASREKMPLHKSHELSGKESFFPDCVYIEDSGSRSPNEATISFPMRRSTFLSYLKLHNSDCDLDMATADGELKRNAESNLEKRFRRDDLKETFKKSQSLRTLGLEAAPLSEAASKRPIVTPLCRSASARHIRETLRDPVVTPKSRLVDRMPPLGPHRSQRSSLNSYLPKSLQLSKLGTAVQRQRSFVTASRIRRIDFMH